MDEFKFHLHLHLKIIPIGGIFSERKTQKYPIGGIFSEKFTPVGGIFFSHNMHVAP